MLVTSNDPVIAESPLLCPVDKNVCEAETKFCPSHEPEIPAAVKEAGADPYVNSPPTGL